MKGINEMDFEREMKIVRRILEYADRHGLYIVEAWGVVEPGYDDVVTLLADWNEPSTHPDSYDAKHPGYAEKRRRTSKIGRYVLENLEHVNIDWHDEWETCQDCGKLVRTSPDSYSWEPYFIILNDCELVCFDCLEDEVEAVIEEYQNQNDKVVPSHFITQIKDAGFDCLEDCEIFESGFHPGQNDTPENVLNDIYERVGERWFHNTFDYIWTITGVGQFDIGFTVLVRKKYE